MTNPIYAIGDIHGQLAALENALTLIEADGGPDAQIVFLGDYTDRGPDSKGVIDLLSSGQDAGRNWVFVKGNHDQMYSLFLQSPPQADPYMMVEHYWLHPRLGGDTTLASYGVNASGTRRLKHVHQEALAAIPKRHIEFMAGLSINYQTDTQFFVHAGIRPGIPLDEQDEEDMIWIRQEFHNYHDKHPKLIIHGHTPVDEATHYGNRVNLDSGAGYGDPLSAVVFEGTKGWLLTHQGRVPLPQANL